MFDQKTLDQLVQALTARIIPHIPNGDVSGSGPPKSVSVVKRLLTVKEAAAYLGRSPSALYKLVARHEISCVRHGRNLRFDVRELDRWIESDKI